MSIVLGTIFVIFLLLWNKFPISSNKIPANVMLTADTMIGDKLYVVVSSSIKIDSADIVRA